MAAAAALATASFAPASNASVHAVTRSTAAHSLRVQEHNPQVSAATRARAASGAPSVPMWNRTVSSGGKSYPISMVGKNPFVKQTNPITTVPTVIVPLVLTFSGSGHVYDPTKPDACAGGKSAVTKVLSSPLFTKRAYTLGGTAVGTGQFVDIFQRANFYKFTKPSGINPGYHVNLSVSVLPKMNFTVSGTEVNAPCGRLGKIDMNTFDYQLLTRLKDFSNEGVNSKKFPILLLDNVVLYNGNVSNCCVLGFHTAISNPYDNGVQTLAVAEYDSGGAFRNMTDIGVLTHEIAEWMDDPVGPNTTPAWGHTGQVSGCQSNLEVGDPLTGTSMTVTVPAGTYHPQENAFFSWFFPPGPSIGVNGWYSMNGTFTSPAAPCS
jgi:hypothetical protein